MSSQVYIPLDIVLRHAGQFELKSALNGDIETAREEIRKADVDWDWVRSNLEPLLLCKFGARDTWRHVDIVVSTDAADSEVTEMRVTASGHFMSWLLHWLDEHNYKHTFLE